MTLPELLTDLERRAAEAERIAATAPVATLYRALADELRAVQDVPAATGDAPERLLDVRAAAKLLDVRPRWLYDHAARLPFARKLGGRTLRFSESGLRRWLERRRSA